MPSEESLPGSAGKKEAITPEKGSMWSEMAGTQEYSEIRSWREFMKIMSVCLSLSECTGE